MSLETDAAKAVRCSQGLESGNYISDKLYLPVE